MRTSNVANVERAREMVDPPPHGIDPTVWRVLRAAHAARVCVTVWVGVSSREVNGYPVRFDLDVDGHVRVALAVTEGTEQRVLVSRITRAAPNASAVAAAVDPAAPTAVVLGAQGELSAALAAGLAGDGWHIEPLALEDAAAVPAATPDLVALVASERRGEAVLAVAHTLRRMADVRDVPVLVVAASSWDIAPGFRHVERARVLVAPFAARELRAALAELRASSRST